MAPPLPALLGLLASAAAYTVTPVDLRVDGLRADSPLLLALGHSNPTFSWALAAAPPTRGAAQASARLEVARDAAFADPVCAAVAAGALATSAQCAPPAAAFSEPNARLFFRVCATAADAGAAVACSPPAALGTGLANASAWAAGWVAAPAAALAPSRPARLRAVADARAALGAGATIERAVAFAASPAYYELFVEGARAATDGARMGSAADFRERVFADAYDVTAALVAGGGAVAVGARVGGANWAHNKNYAAAQLPLRFELHVDATTAAGARVRVVLGGSDAQLAWSAAPDVITYSEW